MYLRGHLLCQNKVRCAARARIGNYRIKGALRASRKNAADPSLTVVTPGGERGGVCPSGLEGEEKERC